MLIGVELQKYRDLLFQQKENIKTYLNQLTRKNDQNLYDHLYLINDLYKEAVLLLKNLEEEIFLRSPFYDDLSIIIRLIKRLNESVNEFLSMDIVARDEIYQENDYPILVRIEELISTLINNLKAIKSKSVLSDRFDEITKDKEKLNEKVQIIESSLDDLKNVELHIIFEDDSDKFKNLATRYEIAFYLVIFFAALYFLGLTFYVTAFESKFLSISFPERIHGNLSTELYIQKISFLILSTTLAAFLLKRSFMNRRLADEAYRTAKELDALPRYMAGMPEELKEKIRFDLAYKYFGNSIHHESYTSGENLMHENIKANTEFLKSVKSADAGSDKSK